MAENYDEENEYPIEEVYEWEGEECPLCHCYTVVRSGHCMTCMSCGWSACDA